MIQATKKLDLQQIRTFHYHYFRTLTLEVLFTGNIILTHALPIFNNILSTFSYIYRFEQ